jgi:hypothetical protein
MNLEKMNPQNNIIYSSQKIVKYIFYDIHMIIIVCSA